MDPRLDVVRHYQWLRRYGLNDSHSGNLSVRCGDAFWITPTGACADTLEADELVRCSLEDDMPANASLDAPLHRAVYRENPAIGAVMHSHGAWSVAATLFGDSFRPVDFEGQLYFATVPVLDIAYADYVEKSPRLVAAALREAHLAVVRGHGVYAGGKDLNQAYKWTCSFELSAKTFLLARQAGTLPAEAPD